MSISVNDVIPLSQARANFSDLAEAVKAGAEKIITKNGESYIAMIDAQRLDYYHRLERERIHLLLFTLSLSPLGYCIQSNKEDQGKSIKKVFVIICISF